MAYTGLATKVYKGALTTQWANSIKENFDDIAEHRACKMWVCFDGSGVANILDSFNCASVVRNAAGKFTFTMTTGLTNTSYLYYGQGGSDAWGGVEACAESGSNTSTHTGSFDTQWRIMDGGGTSEPTKGMMIVFGHGGPGL